MSDRGDEDRGDEARGDEARGEEPRGNEGRGVEPAAASVGGGVWLRLASSQLTNPWRYIAAAFLLGLAALPLIIGVPGYVDGLTLNSDFRALLPDSAPSVRDLEQVEARFGGTVPMSLTVEASDIEGLHRFVTDLAPRIEALEGSKVTAVDWNISDFKRFVEEHRHLYADGDDLRAIHEALQARLDYERARANPFYIDLGEDEPPDPEATIRRIETRSEEARQEIDERFPGGFLQHPDQNLVMLVVHTRIAGGNTQEVDALREAIAREAEALDPDSYAEGIEIHYGGPVVEMRDETESLIEAVQYSTILTIGFVMIGILVFFLRIRPIPLLALTLTPPLLITFGFAELTVDYLNASSAFLCSIVVGNGINPNVIWLARYFEERRADKTVKESLLSCHRGTWKGTLTASLAAAVAYGSLMSTDYRGFRDFGIVGGMGMVLCWLAAYLLLPALAVAFERWRPLKFTKTKAHRGIYGVVFAKIALGSPRIVLATSLLLTIGAGGLVAVWVAGNPMELDFRNLRSERDPDADTEYVVAASRVILDDTMSGSALAILAPSADSVPDIREQLEEYRQERPRALGEVEAVSDFLPEAQEEKLPLLADLRRVMLEIRPHVDDEMQALIDEQLPPAELEPLTVDDLPASIARPYTERDGTRGRLVFVEHNMTESSWDAEYIGRWSAAARSVRVDGEEHSPPVAGTAVVFADLMETVWRDGPKAIGIAFLATAFLLVVTFRRTDERLLTLSALLIGILWMAGMMALFGMRLNFLNFVAFPITFGNGVDYAVNVMRRYADELDEGKTRAVAIREAVEGTGGAVILCSLTTIIGYSSLYTSSNQALNSFGAAMAISEITCLAVAVLSLPALLHVMSIRRNRATAAAGRLASRDVRHEGV